jgi:hypothetical protein
MDSTSTLLAVISILISSVALVGVMLGLLLQARQLRVSNIQTFRSGHSELVRMAMEYPDLHVNPADKISPDPESLRRNNLLNWGTQHLRFGYEIGAIPEASVRWEIARNFSAAIWREWWARVRDSYVAAANSKKDRQFISIVDEEYARALTSSVNTPPAM